MNPWVYILLKCLAAAPAVSEHLSEAINDHWGKDHVQQALKGLAVVNKIVADVAAVPTNPPVAP